MLERMYVLRLSQIDVSSHQLCFVPTDPVERPRFNKDSANFYKAYIAAAIENAVDKSPIMNPDEMLK